MILGLPLCNIILSSLKSTHKSVNALQTFTLQCFLPASLTLSLTSSTIIVPRSFASQQGNNANQFPSYPCSCFSVLPPPHTHAMQFWKVSSTLRHLWAFFSEICPLSSIWGQSLNSIDMMTLEGAWLRKTWQFLPKSRTSYFIIVICHTNWKKKYGLSAYNSYKVSELNLSFYRIYGCYEAPGQRLECISSVDCHRSCPDHLPSLEERSIVTLGISPTLWCAFVCVIPYLILLCIYSRSSPPKETWKKSTYSCVSLEAQGKGSESDSRVKSSPLSNAKTPGAMSKAGL